VSEPSPFITDDDMTALNQREIVRTAQVVRRVAEVVIAIAGVLVVAWLWNLVRFQQLVSDSPGDGGLGIDIGIVDVTWTERVDIFMQSLGALGQAALVGGVGLALRLYGQVVTLRDGGADITPWKVGDPIEPDDEDD
jgi:hypothetical protein